MDSLVEDVSLVMDGLKHHGVNAELVNANLVFARLEDYSTKDPQCQGKALVDKVVTSFLIDLGLAPPLSDSPDIQILDFVEPNAAAARITTTSALPSSSVVTTESNSTASSSRSVEPAVASCSKRLTQESNIEAWTLSPGLCQAFNEPYSPLALASNPSSPEELTEARESNQMESTTVTNGNGTGAIPKIPSNVLSNGTSTGAIPKVVNTGAIPKVVNTGAIPKVVNTGAIPKVLNSVPSSSSKSEDTFLRKTTASSPSKRESDVLEPLQSVIAAKKLKTSPKSPKLKIIAEQDPSTLNEPIHNQEPPSVIRDRDWKKDTATTSSKSAAYVATLSEMFPEADPAYLWGRAEEIQTEEALGNLIESMLSTNDYARVFRGNSSNQKASSAAGSANELVNSLSDIPSVAVKSEASASSVQGAVASTSKASGSQNKPITTVSSLSEAKKRMSLDIASASAIASGSSNEEVETPAPAREPWQDQLDTFVQIFPDADPSFLEDKARELCGKEDMLRQFVAELLEKKEYPSRKDWLWRQEQLALQKKYTEEFSIPNFLEIIPDPFTYFSDAQRKCSNPSQASMFLRNKYRKLRVNDISNIFSRNNYNLALTCKALDNWTGATLKGRRNQVDYDITKTSGGKGVDVPFLQEIAFIENEKRIVEYLDAKKKRREDAFNKAKANGELMQCQCCYDDEVLLEDVRNCSEGHIFCVSCLQKSSEQRIGDGLTTFPCLENCTAEFGLHMLQEILKPTVFSRMVQRKQAEEVKAAGIEDLVQCPFCDFCNIPPKDDKVFRCLNPDCSKESCRLCKEESHVPLRCDEVERKSEVEMRTYIENKMTEALVRTCWKCKRKFVKEDGCNKMTCTCGAMMCYICRQPVQNYDHFNGQGGDKFDRCPLWSNNDELHVDAVAKVAEAARVEALAQNPGAKLVHDPTLVLPEARNRDRHRHGHGHGMGLAALNLELAPARPGVAALAARGANAQWQALLDLQAAVAERHRARQRGERQAREAQEAVRLAGRLPGDPAVVAEANVAAAQDELARQRHRRREAQAREAEAAAEAAVLRRQQRLERAQQLLAQQKAEHARVRRDRKREDDRQRRHAAEAAVAVDQAARAFNAARPVAQPGNPAPAPAPTHAHTYQAIRAVIRQSAAGRQPAPAQQLAATWHPAATQQPAAAQQPAAVQRPTAVRPYTAAQQPAAVQYHPPTQRPAPVQYYTPTPRPETVAYYAPTQQPAAAHQPAAATLLSNAHNQTTRMMTAQHQPPQDPYMQHAAEVRAFFTQPLPAVPAQQPPAAHQQLPNFDNIMQLHMNPAAWAGPNFQQYRQ